MSNNVRACFFIGLIFTAINLSLWGFSKYYTLGINLTDSLDTRLFLINKWEVPNKRGEYIAFYAPNNGVHEEMFVKTIGGIEGDTVTERNRNFYINGSLIGRAKEYSKTGEKAEIGFTGVIPKGCYFAYSKHKDSYDSRYKKIGLVCSADVIGTAYPLL